MQRFLIIFISITLMASAAQAETIKATVNGLVCAFCAAGIEKIFREQPAVDAIKVDLDNKLVTINTKPGQTMDDATITQFITNAGYTVTGITREH